MSAEYRARRKREALERLYMFAAAEIETSLLEHDVWHSPFLLMDAAAIDTPELHRRIHESGLIWLRGREMPRGRFLVFTDQREGASFIFRKPCAPGEHPVRVGPIPVRLLSMGDTIGEFPFVFAETDSCPGQDRLQKMALSDDGLESVSED